MSRRESFARRSRNLLSVGAILDFPIPHCSKCSAQMVKMGVDWVCKTCTKVTGLREVPKFVPGVDGMTIEVGVEAVEIPIAELYPNRAARRRASRRGA